MTTRAVLQPRSTVWHGRGKALVQLTTEQMVSIGDALLACDYTETEVDLGWFFIRLAERTEGTNGVL